MIAMLFAVALAYQQVDPYSHKMVLPSSPVTDAPAVFKMASAKGEIESGSFVVRPDRDLQAVDVVPSDLKGPEGVIPAAAVDVKVVKVWWAGVSSWDSDRHGRNEPVTLMPRVILHDDGLVKVDREKKINYLRGEYPDGVHYVDILSDGRKTPFKSFVEPVRDADRFVPLDLPKDETRQFWITLKTPLDAKPGLYTGTLSIEQSNNRTIKQLSLRLTVYPFELPLPRTHYDITRQYMPGIMGMTSLRSMLERTKDLGEAERKLFNVYKSAAEHNIHFIHGPGNFTTGDTDDLAVRELAIRYKAGMQMRRFVTGDAIDHDWYDPGPEADKSEAADKARLEKSLTRYRSYLDKTFDIFRKYLGNDFELRLCGRSEASAWGVKRQQPFFREIEVRGGGAVADTGRDIERYLAWGLATANVSADASYSRARRWHLGGGEVLGYYAPSTAVWDPDVWRRRGIRDWYADRDGIFEMAWIQGRNPWNDHTWGGDMYRHETLVLPSADGLIATLSYEAYRELTDDIRYYSLHRLLSEKALGSSDAETKRLGRAEWEWLERVEPDRVVDLAKFRRDVAERIVKLQEKTGEWPHESWTREIPSLANLPPPKSVPAETNLLKRVDLLCEQLRRGEALKLLDGALAAKSAEAPRTELLRAKVKTVLTDARYEEPYDEPRLKLAEGALDELLRTRGATPSVKFESFNRVLDASVAGGCTNVTVKLLETVSAWLERLGNDVHVPGWRNQVELQRVMLYRQTGNDAKAIKAGLALHDAKAEVALRMVAYAVAECGERAGDWQAAALGYAEAFKRTSKESYKEWVYLQRKVEETAAKLKTVRKSKGPDASGGFDGGEAPAISLDED